MKGLRLCAAAASIALCLCPPFPRPTPSLCPCRCRCRCPALQVPANWDKRLGVGADSFNFLIVSRG